MTQTEKLSNSFKNSLILTKTLWSYFKSKKVWFVIPIIAILVITLLQYLMTFVLLKDVDDAASQFLAIVYAASLGPSVLQIFFFVIGIFFMSIKETTFFKRIMLSKITKGEIIFSFLMFSFIITAVGLASTILLNLNLFLLIDSTKSNILPPYLNQFSMGSFFFILVLLLFLNTILTVFLVGISKSKNLYIGGIITIILALPLSIFIIKAIIITTSGLTINIDDLGWLDTLFPFLSDSSLAFLIHTTFDKDYFYPILSILLWSVGLVSATPKTWRWRI